MNPEKQRLILIGCGGTAEMLADSFESSGGYEVVAFAVHRRYLRPSFLGRPVVPYETLGQEFDRDTHKFFVAIGETGLNRLRFHFYQELLANGWQPAGFIASSAQISANALIGRHCFIAENTVIQTSCEIGDDVIILPNCYIAHHVTIGDHAFLAGGVVLSGFASLGRFSFLGSNASVSNCISIAENCVVGIGCACSRDLLEDEALLAPQGNLRGSARELFGRWHEKVARMAQAKLHSIQAHRNAVGMGAAAQGADFQTSASDALKRRPEDGKQE